MQYDNGEVLVAPKTVYWVGTPASVGKVERVEMLKYDVFIIDFDERVSKFTKLIKGNTGQCAFFFNIERMMKDNNIDSNSMLDYARNLIGFIKSLGVDRCMVHTGVIDERISMIFRSEGITYIEKNLNDRKKVFTTIPDLIRPFFINKSQLSRGAIRVNLYASRLKVDIGNVTRPHMPRISGVLKDISLSGMGFVLSNKDDFNFLALKDFIQVRAFMAGYIIKIEMGLVTRLDQERNEMAISFKIDNENMIKENYANILTSNIYTWLEGIIERHGHIKGADDE